MIAYYNEFDPFAAQWLRELIAEGLIAPGVVDDRSIEDVLPSDLEGFSQCHFFAGIGVWSLALRQAGWADDRPIWTGSCPCQPFSAAGKGNGFADERHLWPAFHWLIEQCRPELVVGEQVASKDGLHWLDLVQADLEGSNYASGALDSCAAGFGAPHIRQRLYWMAYATDGRFERIGRSWEGGIAEHCDAQRLAHPMPAGRTERRTESGDGQATAPGSLRGLGEPNRSGEGTQPRNHREACQETAGGTGPDNGAALSLRAGATSGLADTPSGQSGDRPIQSGGEYGQQPQDRRSCGHGGISIHPLDYWRDADWLLCRDPSGPRFRPVEPTHVVMVDAGSICAYVAGSGRAGRETDQTEEIDESVQAVRDDTGPESLSVGSNGVSEPQAVLRPTVYGELAARPNQGPEPEEQSSAIGTTSETDVRNVRASEKTNARPSSERGSVQQRPIEPPDVVRFLPCSLTLAELRADDRTAQALRLLREAIRAEGFMFDPSDSLETIWESFGDAQKRRLQLDHRFDQYLTVQTFPLVENAALKNRLAEVRGAGNAVNLAQAQGFLEALIDLLDSY